MGLFKRIFGGGADDKELQSEPISDQKGSMGPNKEQPDISQYFDPTGRPDWEKSICIAAWKVLTGEATCMRVMNPYGNWTMYLKDDLGKLENMLQNGSISFMRAVEFTPADGKPAIVYRNPSICESKSAVKARISISREAKEHMRGKLDLDVLAREIYLKGQEFGVLPLLGAVQIRMWPKDNEKGADEVVNIPEAVSAEYDFTGASDLSKKDVVIVLDRVEDDAAGMSRPGAINAALLLAAYKELRNIGLADPYHNRMDLTTMTDTVLEKEAIERSGNAMFRNTPLVRSLPSAGALGGNMENGSRDERPYINKKDDHELER